MTEFKKAVTLMYVSQNKQTHDGALCADEMDYETFCKIDDFKNSESLKSLFFNPEAKELIIIVYEVLGSKELKRRVVGVGRSLTYQEKKRAIVEICESLQIHIKYHDLQIGQHRIIN